jgi:uncharacterized repeat protein (TIGR03803 family)
VDGAPTAALVGGIDGNFYGTTSHCGCIGGGSAFKITPGGTLTDLAELSLTNGSIFETMIQATDRNYYGTSDGGGVFNWGTIFEMTSGGAWTVLHNFSYLVDGGEPSVLIQATDGNFYGTTGMGGEFWCVDYTCGTFFRMSMGFRPFVSFIRNWGAVGATAQILGQGFTGTSSVSFDGIPASFTVESDTYLTATVPAGATTAPVIVTTPSGNLKSNQLFRVTPQILSFSPPSGPVGTSVVITGESFTGANGALIGCDQNQTPMSFTVDSDTQITAIVPAGAVSGKIKVRTPGGFATSATGFGITN